MDKAANTTPITVYILLFIGIIACGLFLIFLVKGDKRRKQQHKLDLINLDGSIYSRNYLHFLYRIYRQTPLVRRYLNKVKNTYRAAFPLDEISLNLKSTWQITKCLGISITLLIGIFIFGKNDIPFLIVGFLCCYIIFTNLITKTEENLSLNLLDQFDSLLSDHSAAFEDTHMVDESLSSIIDDLPYEISLHANRISDILHSPEMDLKADEYAELAPNKFLLLYTAVCVSIHEKGDKKTKNGRSLFVSSLDYIKQETATEKLKLLKRQMAFSGKVFAVMIALLLLKPLEVWAIANMPEIATYYSGSIGIISLSIISALTFISYELINILKGDHVEEEESSAFIVKLSELPLAKSYYTAWINRNYTKAQRLQDKLKSVGSKDSINVFFTKKFALALCIFLVTILVSRFAIFEQKRELLKNFEDAFTEAIVPNEEYKAIMRETAYDFNNAIKKCPVPAKNENERKTQLESVTSDIKEKLPSDLPEIYRDLIASELAKRGLDYKGTYYKAYMFIIALLLSVIAFFIPNILLSYKQSIRKLDRDDEVSRFRTLIIVLMHQQGITLNEIFVWLDRFAHAFKPAITDCMINLKKDEIQAIKDMKEAESGFPPFRRLCNSLLYTDKVGIEDAFATLETEREKENRERIEKNDKMLNRCNRIANCIVFVPICAAIILYLLLPIGAYCLSLWNEMSTFK